MDSQKCAFHDAIAQDVGEIKCDVKKILARLGGGDVTMATLSARVKTVETNMSDMDGNQKWLVRLIVGAVILALLGMVLKG